MSKNNKRRSLALSQERKGGDEIEAEAIKGKGGQSQQSVAEASGIHDWHIAEDDGLVKDHNIEHSGNLSVGEGFSSV